MTSTRQFIDVVLINGPFHGRRVRVRRGSGVALPTQRKRYRGDHRPLAEYRPDGSGTRLVYLTTHGADPAGQPCL